MPLHRQNIEGALASLQRQQMIREAIASVSLSHDQDCDCATCRAASGDEEAFARLASELFEWEHES